MVLFKMFTGYCISSTAAVVNVGLMVTSSNPPFWALQQGPSKASPAQLYERDTCKSQWIKVSDTYLKSSTFAPNAVELKGTEIVSIERKRDRHLANPAQ